MNGSAFRPVINQPEAALYIQVPMLETTVALQITVNASCRNAPQGERGLLAEAFGAASVGMGSGFTANVQLGYVLGNGTENGFKFLHGSKA